MAWWHSLQQLHLATLTGLNVVCLHSSCHSADAAAIQQTLHHGGSSCVFTSKASYLVEPLCYPAAPAALPPCCAHANVCVLVQSLFVSHGLLALQVDILQHREEQIKHAEARASVQQQQVEKLQAEIAQYTAEIAKLKVGWSQWQPCLQPVQPPGCTCCTTAARNAAPASWCC